MAVSVNQVREIFARAVEVPAEKRAALVAELCGGDAELRAAVESLVEAHERAGAFLGAPEIGPGQLPAEERLLAGEMVGNYRLVRVIGEGGYGTVYLAGSVARREAARGAESDQGGDGHAAGDRAF
ncbi:MAG TPA: hypothetical protein VHQ47_13515 [Phycisphaerae bacterium]|nr:hypothetical protein [Phycisphaerae bacterium]